MNATARYALDQAAESAEQSHKSAREMVTKLERNYEFAVAAATSWAKKLADLQEALNEA